jgi:hypothetical protein
MVKIAVQAYSYRGRPAGVPDVEIEWNHFSREADPFGSLRVEVFPFLNQYGNLDQETIQGVPRRRLESACMDPTRTNSINSWHSLH